MMKHNSSIFFGWQPIILTLAALLCGLIEPAYCQTDGTALLLQQTPTQAGKITPDAGVHHFELNTEVILTAVPRPGYQFVYWLGDVSDSTANTTIVYLDAPKIVIAVFQRSEFEFLAVEERSQSAPRGGSFASAVDYIQQGYAGGGGSKRPSRRVLTAGQHEREEPEEPEESELEDSPVPEDVDDFPAPVPEPATICLMGLGGLALLRRRHTGRIFEGKQK